MNYNKRRRDREREREYKQNDTRRLIKLDSFSLVSDEGKRRVYRDRARIELLRGEPISPFPNMQATSWVLRGQPSDFVYMLFFKLLCKIVNTLFCCERNHTGNFIMHQFKMCDPKIL